MLGVLTLVVCGKCVAVLLDDVLLVSVLLVSVLPVAVLLVRLVVTDVVGG
jgi:hypothetical protein